MPLTGLPTPPATPPPADTQWVLQRNILLHSLPSEALVSTTVNAETTYEVGQNGPIPGITGAADYALARLYFAQFQQYLNSAPLGFMAVDWTTWPSSNNPGAGSYFKIDGGDFTVSHDGSVGSTLTWPLKLRFTVTTTVTPSGGATLGISLDQVRADIWAALPASSRLTSIAPTSPTLDPEQTGAQLTWVRRNGRVPIALPVLGQVGALTQPMWWDGALRFLVDGYHYTVDALPNGGYTIEGDTYFTRIPGDTSTAITPPSSETGIPHIARFDEDLFDDSLARFA